jgi:hypothetical protein
LKELTIDMLPVVSPKFKGLFDISDSARLENANEARNEYVAAVTAYIVANFSDNNRCRKLWDLSQGYVFVDDVPDAIIADLECDWSRESSTWYAYSNEWRVAFPADLCGIPYCVRHKPDRIESV